MITHSMAKLVTVATSDEWHYKTRQLPLVVDEQLTVRDRAKEDQITIISMLSVDPFFSRIDGDANQRHL